MNKRVFMVMPFSNESAKNAYHSFSAESHLIARVAWTLRLVGKYYNSVHKTAMSSANTKNFGDPVRRELAWPIIPDVLQSIWNKK